MSEKLFVIKLTYIHLFKVTYDPVLCDYENDNLNIFRWIVFRNEISLSYVKPKDGILYSSEIIMDTPCHDFLHQKEDDEKHKMQNYLSKK